MKISYSLSEQKFQAQCIKCRRIVDLPVTQKQIDDWKSGIPIQHAMPNLKREEREMLISGFCGKCWNQLFKEEGTMKALLKIADLLEKRASVPISKTRIKQLLKDDFKDMTSKEFFDLAEYYEMPYGTMKARTGDPLNFLHSKLERELNKSLDVKKIAEVILKEMQLSPGQRRQWNKRHPDEPFPGDHLRWKDVKKWLGDDLNEWKVYLYVGGKKVPLTHTQASAYEIILAGD